MSLISKQVEKLKDEAEWCDMVENKDLARLLRDAADTIETLSAKVRANNLHGGIEYRIVEDMPSAQPEIIRCKDCKYRDENWRRVSVRWLPCMEVQTGSNWFCGSAKRRTDD